jgi:hypothetical protein
MDGAANANGLTHCVVNGKHRAGDQGLAMARWM